MVKMKQIAVSFSTKHRIVSKFNKKTYFIACLEGGVHCNDGTCVLNANVCDTTENCPDGEDETHCRKHFLLFDQKQL